MLVLLTVGSSKRNKNPNSSFFSFDINEIIFYDVNRVRIMNNG